MFSMSQFKYQVFPSFRGKDTRTAFTDHLDTALNQTGIRTFRDDRMRKGEKIDTEIKKAIQASESSVIVISQGYASSRWCLDELVEILDHNREFGHKVLPVFYLVDPSHVSEHTGSFGEAFDVLVKEFEEDIDLVNRWKEALVQVAGLSGLVLLQHQYEATFIKQIVKEVQDSCCRSVDDCCHLQCVPENKKETPTNFIPQRKDSCCRSADDSCHLQCVPENKTETPTNFIPQRKDSCCRSVDDCCHPQCVPEYEKQCVNSKC